MPERPLLIDVVDDEELVRKALGRLIESAGFDVRIFASGEEFLLCTQTRRAHCVVLDIRMPQMDGFAVQQALMHHDDQPTPVVIVTGDDSSEHRSRALRHGASAYLRKPVDDALLLDAIRQALRSVPGTDFRH
jgi:FixJ family two-component response regulator